MNNDNISNLLGLEDFILEEVIKENDNLIIVGHIERKEHTCPRCACKTREVKDIRVQLIKDIPAFDKNVFIKLKKQRYICRHCKKSFLEDNSFLQKYQRTTNRVLDKIFKMTSEVNSFTFIANELNIPITTLIRKFDLIEYPTQNFENVEVVAIDEFKGNTGGEKYNCIIADAKEKIVLDILPKRYKKDLENYFYKVKSKNKQNIKYFISDMWRTYFDVAKSKFKNSKFVVDKYHFIRQCIWSFENVRKEEQKKFSSNKRIYFKRSKSLLKKRFEFLTDQEKQQVNNMLYLSENITTAYFLKEDFLKILECNNSFEAKKILKEWINFAKNCNLKHFQNCAKTYENWEIGILNSFDTPYTNGYIEGCNNKIKVLKRNGYGYRNFERFRNRILHIFNYKKINKIK